MQELSEVFKSLSRLVVEQGTVLDRIDYNVLAAKEDIKKANRELEKTLAYEESPRARACQFCLV